MSTSPIAPRHLTHQLALILAIACSSAAALIFEIALTRIFAVTQFYHFAFMAVSLALLGDGASGSALLALTFGFAFVVACGAICYGVCALLVNGTKRTSPRLSAFN